MRILVGVFCGLLFLLFFVAWLFEPVLRDAGCGSEGGGSCAAGPMSYALISAAAVCLVASVVWLWPSGDRRRRKRAHPDDGANDD
jgi:hypothetical protein